MRNELSLSLLRVFRRLQTCGAKATFTQLRTAHSATLRCSCLLRAVVAHDAALLLLLFFFFWFFVVVVVVFIMMIECWYAGF